MPDVLVVGAGPAGLATASHLAAAGVSVLVVDRDDAPGGVPRHADHPGFGLRDRRRPQRGPAYAAALLDEAVREGAEVVPGTTVTSVSPDGRTVALTSPTGREILSPAAVVLATGCRERPRSALLVPGSRPAGVYTTGWLQRAVHLAHEPVGTRAVVIGAEHVSYSAVVTLAEAGCRTVAMVTEQPRTTTFAAFDVAARARYRFRLLTRTTVTAIIGRDRVTAVEVTAAGRTTRIPCDTVVFTGDWIAEHTLGREMGLAMGSRGPLVDQGLRTSAPGVVAAGNLVHAAAPAEACAADGATAAASVLAWLDDEAWPPGVPVLAGPDLAWCTPGRITPRGVGPVTVEAARPLRAPEFRLEQDDRVLWRGRRPWAMPTRPLSLPADWQPRVDPTGGPVRIGAPTLPA